MAKYWTGRTVLASVIVSAQNGIEESREPGTVFWESLRATD